MKTKMTDLEILESVINENEINNFNQTMGLITYNQIFEGKEKEEEEEINLNVENDFKVNVIAKQQQEENLIENTNISLDGNYEECINYLNWAMNVYAGKGNMSVEKKGIAFFDAINTLKNKFGVSVSTQWLKQFCNNQEHKIKHVTYMLKISGFISEKELPKNQHFILVGDEAYLRNDVFDIDDKPILKKVVTTVPTKTSFRGNMINEGRSNLPKIFDMVVTKEEFDLKENQIKEFRNKCLREWENERLDLEQQKIYANKLKIISILADEELDYEEMENLSPDLKMKDVVVAKTQQFRLN